MPKVYKFILIKIKWVIQLQSDHIHRLLIALWLMAAWLIEASVCVKNGLNFNRNCRLTIKITP